MFTILKRIVLIVILQVLASQAWAGEGAWLPLQDHDLRPQPSHEQLLAAQ